MAESVELLADMELSADQYDLVRTLVYERSGINLGPNRQQLVQARLAKRLRRREPNDLANYFRKLKENPTGEEISALIDVISTNTTQFFRESDHFEFLAGSIEHRLTRGHWQRMNDTIRIWCAACSTGEEAYSVAMTVASLLERYQRVRVKILATDISTKALAVAESGRYEDKKIDVVPPGFREKYFITVPSNKSPQVEVASSLKQMITFKQFNLMEKDYPFRFGFDYIFCRNVMIYFDRRTQQAVVEKLSQQLRPGGYLLVGHSESLNRISHNLKYVEPTIYQVEGCHGRI
jgi:chemotaxis protein methyltransferase CheR